VKREEINRIKEIRVHTGSKLTHIVA